MEAGIHAAASISAACDKIIRNPTASDSKSARPVAFRPPQEASPQAQQLLNEILAAADAATDLNDLAVRLEPVANAASALSSFEHEAILGTISVALSSYEYWLANESTFRAELFNEYGDCAQQYFSMGYSLEAAREACTNRNVTDSWDGSYDPSKGPVLRLASAMQRNECSLPYRFKRLLAKDILGAFGGALSTIWSGVGVLVGVFGGAAVGSFTEFLEGTWYLFWCAM